MRQQELNQAGQALGQQMREAQEQQEQQEAEERAKILQSERSLILTPSLSGVTMRRR